VRDVALGCGKQVNIEMEGQETELDKTIIEAIKDPLTHLVRNSVDHGIELPEDRVKAGKDPTGRLILRAFHEGGQVNIEITDDGAGLNRERIRQKAVERGMVTPEQAARLSEREIFNLIFLPGFSTAQKVTNVSGRGVGMDVVKTNVEKIGGVVDVQSTPGLGTTVRVKIPLTLAIIPALVVTCGGDRYAIPQVSLLELVRLEAEQARTGIEMVHGVPVHRLRGRLLPLVYLRRELQLASGNKHDGATSTTDSHSNWETIHFSQARTKHQQWLGRLRDVLDGKATITSQQAGSHTGCAFGKWLYSSGLKNYGDLPEIHAVEKTHKEFHGLVSNIIGLKEQGNQTGAEESFRQLGPLSTQIIELLTTLEHKATQAESVNIVVLQADEHEFGLVVDGINDTEEIVVKPLRKQLKTVKTFAGSSIMGDGKVALILDVLGLAQRASVVSETRDRAVTEKDAESAGSSGEKQTFLLFAGQGDSRMAIPLSALARLEEFPVAQLEMSGKQWVTQYRGQILPLIRLNVVLDERRVKTRALPLLPTPDSGPIQVLVLNHEGRSFGLVVDKILDIVEDQAEVKSPATRPCVLYSVVIGERVTELLDIPAILKTAATLTVGQPTAAMHAAEGGH
jgi:chemotaxis protein histidine kinase CheA